MLKQQKRLIEILHQGTSSILSFSNAQKPALYFPSSASASSTVDLAPSIGSFGPRYPLNAVLHHPGLTSWNSTPGLAWLISTVSRLSAAFETEYGILSVGGLAPEVTNANDPRPEDTLMTRGVIALRNNGRNNVETRATDVTLVSRIRLYTERKSELSGAGPPAMPALLTRTG